MEKKYFFFDIDGTLTDRSTGKIVPSAREVNSQKPMGLKIWFVVEAMAV